MVTVYKRQTTTTKLKLGLLGTNLITVINRVRVNFLKVKVLLAVGAIYSLFAVSSKVVFLAAVFCSRLATKTKQEKFRTAECVDTPNIYINRGVRRSHVFSLNQNDQMHRSRMEIKLEIQLKITPLLSVLNPLHLNISIHILHTVLCTIPTVLTSRIRLTIKRFVGW